MTQRLPVRPATSPWAGRRTSPRLLAFVAAMALAILGVLGTPSAAAAFDEETIHSLTNQARSSNGLGPLTLNSSLSQVAAGWANQMAANGTLSHNPGYSSQIPGGWSKAAENVAQGYPTGAAVHEGWMNSPGHRANILGDFTDIGIAHISAGGTTWSVEVFAKYGSSVPAPAPPAPAPAPAPAPPPVPAAPPAAQAPPEEAPETTPTPSATATTPSPTDEAAASAPADVRNGQAQGRAEASGTDPGTAGSGGLATKVGLGAALLAAIGAALAGWFRFKRIR